MEDNTALYDKIRALLAKAQSSDSEAEREAFMRGVNKLLTQHNLSMASIEAHTVKGKKSQEDITKQQLNLNDLTNRKEGSWAMRLINGVSKYYYCSSIHLLVPGRDEMGRVAIFGKEYNIIVAKMMIEYLVPTIKKMASKSYADYKGEQKRGAYIRDFLGFCTNRICLRFQQMREEEKVQEWKDNGATQGLVLFNDKAIEVAMVQEFPDMFTAKEREMKIRDGSVDGNIAGKNIGLNNQVTGSSDNSRLN